MESVIQKFPLQSFDQIRIKTHSIGAYSLISKLYKYWDPRSVFQKLAPFLNCEGSRLCAVGCLSGVVGQGKEEELREEHGLNLG